MAFSSTRTACALAFLLSSAVAPSALAHAHLKQQSPAADSQVAVAPQALTLQFSEGIEPAFSGVTVTSEDKQTIKTGAISLDDKDKTQLTVPLDQALSAGTYRVEWHVVSVDGHKTKGSYRFSVK
ncbi:CopC domain-containing protein YobA [Enterobacter soli]|uniref:CopC domain-containing protein YobA n=1 Tax=Enterobacter soli TaxID=885040 RepID=UPI0034CF23D3